MCALTRLTLLAGPVKEDFRATVVVGNLARDEAHAFFFNYVMPFVTHLPPVETDTFARVYEVCGGNPGLLPKCASKAAALCSWELGAQYGHTHLHCFAYVCR